MKPRTDMRILLVGTAGWDGWSDELAPQYDCEVAGIIDPQSPSARRRHADDARWARRRRRDRLHLAGRGDRRTCRRWRGRGINIVLGTTGWQPHEAGTARRRWPTPAPASSRRRTSRPAWCCSRRSWRSAAALFAGQQEFGAWLHEAHHATKKDAPSGTALLLKRAMEEAGYARPIDVSSTRAGYHSRDAHGRLRRSGRIDYADAHGARSRRRSRAARCTAAQVGAGPARLVHDAGRAGAVERLAASGSQKCEPNSQGRSVGGP